jgi:hypothetical protein
MHEIDKVGITPDTACGLPGRERTVVVAGECPSALPSTAMLWWQQSIKILPPPGQISLEGLRSLVGVATLWMTVFIDRRITFAVRNRLRAMWIEMVVLLIHVDQGLQWFASESISVMFPYWYCRSAISSAGRGWIKPCPRAGWLRHHSWKPAWEYCGLQVSDQSCSS